MRLAAINHIAQRLGLSVGMTLADARAQVPDLMVYDHDPDADNRWLERLADGCARYTPMVAMAPPDMLLLDITGCAHPFGSEGALVSDAAKRLADLGMTLHHACASTAEGARALSRYGTATARDEDEAIRHLPILALELDPEAELGLRRAGLKTIGAVAQRPPATIAARFGQQAVTALNRLLGKARGPLDPRIMAAAIHVERRFAEPVARTDYVLMILEELAAEAGEELQRRGKGGRRFTAAFFRSDGLAQKLRIETSRPTRDTETLMRLFNERLDSLNDPLDPGFGFDSVRLSVALEEEFAETQIALEGGETEDSEVAALVDRLSVRFGRGRLQRLTPYDSHIPERTQTAQPAIAASAQAVWQSPETGEPPLRPLMLFDPPQPITVIAEVPDGPPRRFRWRHTVRDVIRHEGPERIAAEWWRAKRDPLGETRLTRDYYRIEDSVGRRYWVFRHGLIEREKPDPNWYLHGLFA